MLARRLRRVLCHFLNVHVTIGQGVALLAFLLLRLLPAKIPLLFNGDYHERIVVLLQRM